MKRWVLLVVAALATGCPVGGLGGEGEGEGEGEGDVGEGEGDPGVPDGAPNRRSCTNSFQNAVSFDYGRLDGFLAAVVQTSANGCRADANMTIRSS